MELAKILIQERKHLGKTQQEVADDLFISRQTLSNWENGKNFPDVPTLIKLSNYYNFSLDIMKGDKQLMKKVETDYELINIKKANKKYSWSLLILLTLVIIAAFAMSFFENQTGVVKSLTLVMSLLILASLYVSYNFLKQVYQKYADEPNTPLFVPKVFGYGIAINPYHKIGKLIFALLFLAIAIFFLVTIVSLFVWFLVDVM